jgi:hypothetical protein
MVTNSHLFFMMMTGCAKMVTNKLLEASRHHATSGRRHVLVVEALSGKTILVVEALSSKMVQIDTLTHRRIDRSKKGLEDSSPPVAWCNIVVTSGLSSCLRMFQQDHKFLVRTPIQSTSSQMNYLRENQPLCEMELI